MSRFLSYLAFMRKAFLQLHGAVLLAGFTGILGRLITLNEGLLVWYRLLITSLTLWLLFFFQKKLQRISFREMMKITGVGAIAALHWVTFYGSIKYANVSVALVCFSAIGFFTAIFEPLIVRKKMNWTELPAEPHCHCGYFIDLSFRSAIQNRHHCRPYFGPAGQYIPDL